MRWAIGPLHIGQVDRAGFWPQSSQQHTCAHGAKATRAVFSRHTTHLPPGSPPPWAKADLEALLVLAADAAARSPSSDSTLPSKRCLVRLSRSSPARRSADLSRSISAPLRRRSVSCIPSLSGSGGRSLSFSLIPQVVTLRLFCRTVLCVSSTSKTKFTGAKRAT